MNKNLTGKVILILAVMLVFVWGIILGPDPGSSLSAMKSQGVLAAMRQNIHLGLDLRGGTHLILQVKVNDAVRADADTAIDRLKTEMRTANIAYSDVSQPDQQNEPDKIVIKGVGPE
jgi:preprotein translocase subunit SecD